MRKEKERERERERNDRKERESVESELMLKHVIRVTCESKGTDFIFWLTRWQTNQRELAYSLSIIFNKQPSTLTFLGLLICLHFILSSNSFGFKTSYFLVSSLSLVVAWLKLDKSPNLSRSSYFIRESQKNGAKKAYCQTSFCTFSLCISLCSNFWNHSFLDNPLFLNMFSNILIIVLNCPTLLA